MATAGVVIDIRDHRRSELETDRMRALADATVEGLLVCDGQTIVSANKVFSQLAGVPAENLVGGTLESCFPDPVARLELMSRPNHPIETELRHHDGAATPVELIMRPIIFAERPHHVIAVRDLKARKDAEQHIHFLAHHDALTELAEPKPIQRAHRSGNRGLPPGKSLGVLCLDLDRFKEINDLFGHAAGDRTLQAVASRISALLDDRQMMARLGGDEFAILVPDITSACGGWPSRRIHSRGASQFERGAGNHDGNQYRHRAQPGRCGRPSGAAQPCRRGALSGEVRRPQHLSFLRGEDGR